MNVTPSAKLQGCLCNRTLHFQKAGDWCWSFPTVGLGFFPCSHLWILCIDSKFFSKHCPYNPSEVKADRINFSSHVGKGKREKLSNFRCRWAFEKRQNCICIWNQHFPSFLWTTTERKEKITLARLPSLHLKIEDPPFRMLVLSPCSFPCDSSGAVDVGLTSTGISSDRICLQHQLAKSEFFFPVPDKLPSRQQEHINCRLKQNPDQVSEFSSQL